MVGVFKFVQITPRETRKENASPPSAQFIKRSTRTALALIVKALAMIVTVHCFRTSRTPQNAQLLIADQTKVGAGLSKDVNARVLSMQKTKVSVNNAKTFSQGAEPASKPTILGLKKRKLKLVRPLKVSMLGRAHMWYVKDVLETQCFLSGLRCKMAGPLLGVKHAVS